MVEVNVSDRDNIDKAIRLTLESCDSIVDVTMQGNKLAIVPVERGEGEICLSAESNGVTAYLSVPVTVNEVIDGIDGPSAQGAVMSVAGRRFHAVGFAGHTMRVFSVNGALIAEFDVVDDDYSVDLPVEAGFYVIADVNSSRTVKCYIK